MNTHHEQNILKRNAELEKVLAAKNHELEIEAALEKVRAVAMAMRKADDLMLISEVIYKQLSVLGFTNVRNVQIAIDDDEKQLYNGVEYSEYYQNRLVEVPYDSSPMFREIVNELKRSDNAFYQKEIKGKDFKDWRKWRISIDTKNHPDIASATSMCFYLHSVGAGMLGISTFNAITSDQLEILKRLRNVFELSYKRYVDIEKAEEQAREAQIQLALEKVRARTMAMQKSDELREAVLVIYEQLQQLNFESKACNIIIIDKKSGSAQYWVSGFLQEIFPESYAVPYLDHPYQDALLKPWKQGDKYVVYEYTGKMKQSFDEIFFTHTEFRNVPDEAKKIMIGLESVKLSTAFISYGALQALGAEPLSEENANILQRFAKVFEQTYTRFLDLQKAEAQASEAQIEAALEKVRSRSLAMHTANELGEVVTVIVEKLKDLGIVLDANGVVLCTYFQHSKDVMHWIVSPDFSMAGSYLLPYFDHPIFNAAWHSKENGDEYFSKAFSVEEKNSFFEYAFEHSDYRHFPDEFKHWIFQNDQHILSFAWQKNSAILIPSHTGVLPSEEDIAILKRFAKVFEQSYVRFLDLQRSEEQAKESQIQLALERVRARTMAMQKSNELPETSYILFQQLKELGETTVQNSIGIVNEETGFVELSTTVQGHHLPHTLNVPMNDPYVMAKAVAAWKAKHRSLKVEVRGQELIDYNEHRNSFFETKVKFPEDQWIVNIIFFSKGWLSFSSDKDISEETFDLLKRFAAVFEQTYIRFNDLKQAEEQARESQIQLALERVRARTMAMQKSDELMETAVVLFDQLKQLGENIERTIIGVMNEEERVVDVWATRPDGSQMDKMQKFPIDEPILMQKVFAAWQQQKRSIVIDLQGEELESYFQFLKGKGTRLKRESFGERRVENFAFFSKGMLGIISVDPNTPANVELYERFAAVFDQTYTRFLDLQKAEAQTRDAQIEIAVERVRAKALAMHKSKEILGVAISLREELVKLDLPGVSAATIFLEQDNGNFRLWDLTEFIDSAEGPLLSLDIEFDPDNIDPDLFFLKFLRSTERYFIVETDAADYRRWEKWYRNYDPVGADKFLQFLENSKLNHAWHTAVPLSSGTLKVDFIYPPPAEMEFILPKMAAAFDLSYKRFLDLQKAEAQAREAQIEAALERVRSRTMAMQTSAELTDVAGLLFEQVSALGIKTWTAGFNVWSEDNNSYVDYITSPQGGFIEPYTVYTETAEALTDISNARKSGVEFDVQYVEGEKIKQLYLALTKLDEKQYEIMLQDGVRFPSHQYEHFVFGSKVSLMFITYEPVPEAHDIFKRLGKVFEQTYTRFLDLQKAEAQAREAIKQASVDRIRAEIASMRTTNDLQRIQPLIWNELTTLGVPVTRCGVFIMDEEHEQVDTFLSTPEGKSIASFTSNYSDVSVITEALPFWRKKEIYRAHWDEATFLAQAQTLLSQGNIASTETYFTEHRPKDFYLHFLPFLQGILYVGNETPLKEDELQLVQNLADAFSIAYARYEDFNKLELAKEQIENTLTNLKQAQAQLVQSEKMASLGELTAGIAHEIQNPLNFVNNFSEVNTELIAEMKEEIEKGNIEEVKAIANDIADNEQKINHHGKRADAIVKGMLQHSRSSSGVKEPSDINVLADEYLRLAYHGLRAKDKSFNATMKTDYDAAIGKINIVPQDVGRSVLNLITNAFYAVSEKKKQKADGYEPTVTVTTKRINGKVEIRVADNGNGIPQKVLDKIFQPFFTTKPTGQGTGLGLSLSYDIVKAHGGEINVMTREGEGSEFNIQLPT